MFMQEDIAKIDPETLQASQIIDLLEILPCLVISSYISPGSSNCNTARRRVNASAVSRLDNDSQIYSDERLAAVCRSCPALLQSLQRLSL